MTTLLIVKLREWTPGRLPEILSSCGAERIPDKVIPQLRIVRALVPEGADPDAVLAALRAHPDVDPERTGFEPFLRPVSAAAYFGVSGGLGDTYGKFEHSGAWGTLARYLGASLAYGSPTVRLAVCDTGIVSHVDLDMASALMWDATDDSTDATDEFSYGDPNEEYAPNRSHGTWCAGQIFAKPNTAGITGVAAGCRPVIVKIYPDYGAGDAAVFPLLAGVDGVVWAADAGARAINFSSGTYDTNDPATRDPARMAAYAAMEDASAYCRSLGAVIVAAAGNDNRNSDEQWIFPAETPGVLMVGASDQAGHKANFGGTTSGSNYGPAVDICCYGGFAGPALRSPCNNDAGWTAYYRGEGPYPLPSTLTSTNGRGTSFAAPQVTATFGLVFTANPALTIDQAIGVVLSSARPFTYTTDFPNAAGFLDTQAAVRKALSLRADFAAQPVPYLERTWQPSVPTSGIASLTLNGPVSFRLRAFAQQRIDHVELRLGDEVVYSGHPAELSAVASSAGTLRQVRAIVHTDGGGVGDETYTEIQTASISAVSVVSLLPPDPLRLSAHAWSVVDGAAPLSGYRVAGSTVVVSCSTATVGPVSYPTATTWEAAISDLPAEASVVTVSDGTDTVTVEVEGTIPLDGVSGRGDAAAILAGGGVTALLPVASGRGAAASATAIGSAAVGLAGLSARGAVSPVVARASSAVALSSVQGTGSAAEVDGFSAPLLVRSPSYGIGYYAGPWSSWAVDPRLAESSGIAVDLGAVSGKGAAAVVAARASAAVALSSVQGYGGVAAIETKTGARALVPGAQGRGDAASVQVQTGAAVALPFVTGTGRANPIDASADGTVALLAGVSGAGEAVAIDVQTGVVVALVGVVGRGGAAAIEVGVPGTGKTIRLRLRSLSPEVDLYSMQARVRLRDRSPRLTLSARKE